MRRHAAALLFAVGALLLTPGAAGLPNVPGDPTPPVVTPVITGTLGLNGWYTTNVTVNWSVDGPESIILSTTGCNAGHLHAQYDRHDARLLGRERRRQSRRSRRRSRSTRPRRRRPQRRRDPPTRTAGTTTASPSTSTGTTRPRASSRAPRMRPTAGLTRAERRSPGPAATSPGTRHRRCCRSSTTRRRRSRARRLAQPDANGWHNHAVTVTFQGTDGTSGVATCTQTTYSGPDDPSVALSGTCVDQAGNQSPSALFTTKYDETPPQATATASRPADVERLAQPSAHGQLRRERCDLGARLVRPDRVVRRA